MRETIKDNQQRVIGYLDDSGNTKRLFNHKNELVAFYNKSCNRTYSASGRFLFEGEKLMLALR